MSKKCLNRSDANCFAFLPLRKYKQKILITYKFSVTNLCSFKCFVINYSTVFRRTFHATKKDFIKKPMQKNVEKKFRHCVLNQNYFMKRSLLQIAAFCIKIASSINYKCNLSQVVYTKIISICLSFILIYRKNSGSDWRTKFSVSMCKLEKFCIHSIELTICPIEFSFFPLISKLSTRLSH